MIITVEVKDKTSRRDTVNQVFEEYKKQRLVEIGAPINSLYPCSTTTFIHIKSKGNLITYIVEEE